MKNRDYLSVLNYFFAKIFNYNDDSLLVALEYILHIVQKGKNLSQQELEKIKPHIDSFEENIQYLSLEIYSITLRNNPHLVRSEIPFCLEKLGDFEESVRRIFMDLLIQFYLDAGEFQSQIFNVFKKRLTDEIWKLRIISIEFYTKLLQLDSNQFAPQKNDFLVLLEEQDLDVIAYALDFLYLLIMKTYIPKDISYLIESVSTNKWVAQEKILWLLGKVGSQNIELIQNYILDLVKLLDSIDNIVVIKTRQIILEIMDKHITIFDKALFFWLKSKNFESIDEIEKILAQSILNLGCTRFFQLYNLISPDFPEITYNLSHALKRVWQKNKNILREIFATYPIDVILKPDIYEYFKLQSLLRDINKYEISLLCFNTLTDVSSFGDARCDLLKDDLIQFLIELRPELEHVKINDWITNQLQEYHIVNIEELCNHFNLTKRQLDLILQNLIKLGLFKASIQEEIIKIPTSNGPMGNFFDLYIQKKWKLWNDKNSSLQNITLSVRICNNLSKTISNVKLIIVNSSEILEFVDQSDNSTNIFPMIHPNESKELSWTLQKKAEKSMEPHIISLKLVIFYYKDTKLSTWSKKLDVLML